MKQITQAEQRLLEAADPAPNLLYNEQDTEDAHDQ